MSLSKVETRIAILFLLLIPLSIVHIARAEEQFGISLDCLEPCKDKTMDYSKDIMLVLTIKNNLDYWVSIGQEMNTNYQTDFRMNLENNNLQAGNNIESHTDILGKRVLIKPKTELQVYIPFNTYNKLGKDNRLGEWKISPVLQINNVEFYNNPFESKSIPLSDRSTGQSYTINSPIKGNVLGFKVIKPETEVQGEKSSVIPKGLLETFYQDYIKIIITTVSGAVIGYLIINRLSRKSRKR